MLVGAFLHMFLIQEPSGWGLCHPQYHWPLQQREGKMENPAQDLKQFCPEVTHITVTDILLTIASQMVSHAYPKRSER